MRRVSEPASVTDPARRAREYVLDAHRETVETVIRCADAVADEWGGPYSEDRAAVADPLRSELQARGVWARLPDVLVGAVRAAGYSLSASPVAGPPYVATTSRGPMLRATVPDGRLVVLLCVFEVERDSGSPPRYVRGPRTPADAVRVTLE
jgi:hypothetical protein